MIVLEPVRQCVVRLFLICALAAATSACGLFGGGGPPPPEPQPGDDAERPGVVRRPAVMPTSQPEAPSSLPVSGWVRVSQESTVPAGGVRQVRVTCPAGKRVFGGGGSGAVAMAQSYPASESEWTTVFVNETSLDLNVVAWAICANTGDGEGPVDQMSPID